MGKEYTARMDFNLDEVMHQVFSEGSREWEDRFYERMLDGDSNRLALAVTRSEGQRGRGLSEEAFVDLVKRFAMFAAAQQVRFLREHPDVVGKEFVFEMGFRCTDEDGNTY